MNPTPDLGLSALLAGTDAVGRALFFILLAMSLASWLVMALQALDRRRSGQAGRRFLQDFWAAATLGAAQSLAEAAASQAAPARLAARALAARAHHARHAQAARLDAAGGPEAFVERALKQALDEEALRAERGLTLLATVGATAPFVGLFGTVWGVYHALLGIGAAGQMGSLSQVAAPVGEALVMTGLGLAVAIPAVVAYNTLVRSNRLRAGQLDGHAHQLMTLLGTGTALAAPAANTPPAQAPARAAA